MNTMVVVALLVIKHDIGYLQPVCSAVCTVINIFHTVKTLIYYAKNKILLNKLYLLPLCLLQLQIFTCTSSTFSRSTFT